MGLFDRLERTLERAVNGAFAKAFKSSVQPVEIASAMRRAMDDRAAATSRISGKAASRAVVTNMFTVELSTKDYDDLTAYADDLTDELLASAEEHIDSQRYQVAGPMRIIFAENIDLDTGVFTLRPASARRPFEITPEGVADRAVPAHHDYEEFEELSVGMPVGRDGDRSGDRQAEQRAEHRKPVPAPEPAPQRDEPHRAHDADDDGSPRAWGTDAAAQAAAAQSVSEPGRAGAALGAAAGGAAVVGLHRADGPGAGDRDHSPQHARDDEPRSRESLRPAHAERPVPTDRQAPPARSTERQAQPEQAEQPARRPAPVRRPWLDIDGDRYPLLGALTIVGRDHSADIVLDDPGISRRHAEIRVTNDGPHTVITLTDLDSTNGVFVNGDRIRSEHVRDGDRITLGRSSMVLRTGSR